MSVSYRPRAEPQFLKPKLTNSYDSILIRVLRHAYTNQSQERRRSYGDEKKDTKYVRDTAFLLSIEQLNRAEG